jgi:hypothetical protein
MRDNIKEVFCILILQPLKFWKIKFATIEPHFSKVNKELFNKQVPNISRK